MTELGTIFKEARLKLGLTINEMAARIKIRSEFLTAIEEEEFHQLPGEAYVRPFIRTYARALSLDEKEIAAELDTYLAPSEEELERQRELHEKIRIKHRNRYILRGISLGIIAIGVFLILFWLLN